MDEPSPSTIDPSPSRMRERLPLYVVSAVLFLILATFAYAAVKYFFFSQSQGVVNGTPITSYSSLHVSTSSISTSNAEESAETQITGKIFYVSTSTSTGQDTIILDFDRGIKFKTGIPFVTRGDEGQFLLMSPDKTKIALLGMGTSTFETSSFDLSSLLVQKASACMSIPAVTLYVIDLESKKKVQLVEDLLFNDYAPSSVQWIDNDSLCYQEFHHTDNSPCSGIEGGKTWKVALDGTKTELDPAACQPRKQEGSVSGWHTLNVTENKTLIKTDDGIYPLYKRWESTSILLKNERTHQQKILVARGSQLVTSEYMILSPLKNAFLFETVKEGVSKEEKGGNEEIEVMSLNGEVILRIPGTYSTWIP